MRILATRLLAAILILLAMGCTGLAGIPKTFGYVELRPPSTLLTPGALVYVRDNDPFVAGVICDTENSLGPAYVPRNSRTSDVQVHKLNGANMSLGADTLAGLKADPRLEAVESVEATLSNATIVELDDSDVLEHLRSRSPWCTQAVAQRLVAKFPVTMVSSALIGDVTYTVKWHVGATVSVQDRLHAVMALSGQLGGQHETDTTIVAKNLVWGIRDDRYLAGLSIPSVNEHDIPRGAAAMPILSKRPVARVQ